MNGAEILDDIRRSIELLAELDDPAATRAAQALSRWLAGESFDSALDLPSDWRQRERIAARDAPLGALVALHPELDARALARRLVAGVPASPTPGIRPDGEAGLLEDLARAGVHLTERSWRRLIAQARGQRDACNGHTSVAASTNQETS